MEETELNRQNPETPEFLRLTMAGPRGAGGTSGPGTSDTDRNKACGAIPTFPLSFDEVKNMGLKT